jgi:hypothetical protein
MKNSELAEVCAKLSDEEITATGTNDIIREFIFDNMPPGLIKVNQTPITGSNYEKDETYQVKDAVKVNHTSKYYLKERLIVEKNGEEIQIPINDVDWEKAIYRITNRIQKEKEGKLNKNQFWIFLNTDMLKVLSDKSEEEFAEFLDDFEGFAKFEGINDDYWIRIESITHFTLCEKKGIDVLLD